MNFETRPPPGDGVDGHDETAPPDAGRPSAVAATGAVDDEPSPVVAAVVEPDDRTRAILEQRARELARPPADEASVETIGLAVLAVGRERYGVDVTGVDGIHAVAGLAPVPGLGGHWAGLMNIRGVLHPVLDLRRYLGLTDDEGELGSARAARVAVVSGHGIRLGLLVDDVPEVRQVGPSEVGPSLTGVPDAARGIVRGVTPDMLALVDLDALLSDPKLAVRDELG